MWFSGSSSTRWRESVALDLDLSILREERSVDLRARARVTPWVGGVVSVGEGGEERVERLGGGLFLASSISGSNSGDSMIGGVESFVLLSTCILSMRRRMRSTRTSNSHLDLESERRRRQYCRLPPRPQILGFANTLAHNCLLHHFRNRRFHLQRC